MARIRINKTWLIFILAVVFGLLALILTRSYLASREKALVDQAQDASRKAMTIVVVPTKDMPPGTVLDASQLATREVPSEFINADAIRPDDIAGYFGQKLAWPVTHGAPLLKSQIDPSGRAFASVLKDGTRALTIQVDEINSTSGMTVPGNHIDLLLVRQVGTADEVRPLFQNLLVLATGQVVQGSETPMEGPDGQERKAYSTLTLELTPEQSARMVLAQKLGTLRAVLRGTDDKVVLAQNAVGVNDLFGAPAPRSGGQGMRTATVRPAQPTHVEFIIGGQSDKGINQAVMAAVQGQQMAARAAASNGMPGMPAAMQGMSAATPVAPAMPGSLPGQAAGSLAGMGTPVR